MSSDECDVVISSDNDSDFEPAAKTKKSPMKSKPAAKSKADPKKSKAATTAKPKAPPKKAAPKAKAVKGKPSSPSKAANTSTQFDASSADPENVFETLESATHGGKERLPIEKIYQKLSHVEHVLVRPDSYIGSAQQHTETMWVYEDGKMVFRPITYAPGLFKIFDEILVNAADNKIRDSRMSFVKITIDRTANTIAIKNDGKGIPVELHKDENMYVPELIFGTLLTSSNYDDSQKKMTGGRNGFGAKLCNIFSSEFTLETVCNHKRFKQVWNNNMNKDLKPNEIRKAVIDKVDRDVKDYTQVTFKPDLKRFRMKELDDDIVALFSRRAFDIAGTCKNLKVILNGSKLPVAGFEQYVDYFTRGIKDEQDEILKFEYFKSSERWEVAIGLSPDGEFKQMSFVNSIATTKGGKHVDHVLDKLLPKLIETVKKQLGTKTKMVIQKNHIKNHLWVFANCLIENPSFDSQTKENMTLPIAEFGSVVELGENYIKKVIKNCKIVDNIMAFLRNKLQSQLDQKCHSKKHTKLKGLPKLEDANEAGTKNSHTCTLILTEGDSAKSLAVSGLGVVGRDQYGVFPLKGKVLNTRECTHKQMMENAETNALIKILGLQYKKKYDSQEDIKTLRYGKLMIMADQDQDGSHIKGLVINFIHHNWPSLIRQNFVEEFITPIVKVTKGQQVFSFFSIPEYEEWRNSTENWNTWRIKYYKGLGTSTSKEAKEYFSDMLRHRIKFKYQSGADDDAIVMAFSKARIEDRKGWLTSWMEERKRRRELGLSDIYLYEKDTRNVSYADFINKELVLFSNMDNERSIPCLVDGLKPGQRKVMFTCFKKNLKREMKVAQLAGSVAHMSAYHHGEVSLMQTIINLAQNFVGTNNINLLMPQGQFGTRLQGGKDAASPRYIFTYLNPLTRTLFPPNDDAVLKYLKDDNQKIEPEWYCPIIPMVLANGVAGIGTGWSSNIPCYNPTDLVANIRRLLDGKETKEMTPWYRDFRGDIISLGEGSERYLTVGEVAVLDDQSIEITELPIQQWTQKYKESVMEVMLNGDEKAKTPPLINDFKEYHTDVTVRFVAKMSEQKLREARDQNLHKVFKLTSSLSLSSMVLFDEMGILKRYVSADQILREFYAVRLKLYNKRRDYMLGMLRAEAKKLTNQARFIAEKISGAIKLENVKYKKVVDMLMSRKYDPDPVKRWRDLLVKDDEDEGEEMETSEETQEEEPGTAESTLGTSEKSDFDYLVDMRMRSMTEEAAKRLNALRDSKLAEVSVLEGKTPSMLWEEELVVFETEYKKQSEKEAAELESAVLTAGSGANKRGKDSKTSAKDKKKKATDRKEFLPSNYGERQEIEMKYFIEKRENAKKAGTKGRGKTVKKEDGEIDDVEPEGGSLMDRVLKKRRDSVGTSKPLPDEKSLKRFFKAKSTTSKSSDAGLDKGEDNEDLEIIPHKKSKVTSQKGTKKSPPKKRKRESGESGSESSISVDDNRDGNKSDGDINEGIKSESGNDSDGNDDESNANRDSDGNSDYGSENGLTVQVEKRKLPKRKRATKFFDSDEDKDEETDEDDVYEPTEKQRNLVRTRKPTKLEQQAKKSKLDSEKKDVAVDDKSDDEDDMFANMKPNGLATTNGKKKRIVSDSEEETKHDSDVEEVAVVEDAAGVSGVARQRKKEVVYAEESESGSSEDDEEDDNKKDSDYSD